MQRLAIATCGDRIHQGEATTSYEQVVAARFATMSEIGEHKLKIRFLDPKGQETLGGEGTFTVGEPVAGVTDVEAGVILAYDLPLPVLGRYTVEIALDGNVVTTLPLTVAEAPAAPQGN